MPDRIRWSGVCLTLAAITLVGVGQLASCGDRTRISRLTILISGNTMASLEKCGCSSGQFGGEVRKARLMKEERAAAVKPRPADRGRPAEVILVDTGNFADAETGGSRLNSTGVTRSMTLLDYDAVGLGQEELGYEQARLWDLLKDADLPLTAANLTFKPPAQGEDRSEELNGLIKPWLLITLPSGFTAGLIHIVDRNVLKYEREELGFELADGAEEAKRILQRHKSEADYWILCIANSRREGTTPQSIAALEDLDLVIGFGGGNPREAESPGRAVFPVFVDEPYPQSKDIVRSVTYFKPDRSPPVVIAERLKIKDTYNPDPDVQQIISELKPELEKLANEEAEHSLGGPQLHPWYVGAEACGQCHAKVYEQLLQTTHVHAYESLILQGNKGEKNPNCLPCHVVGFNQPGGWNILHNPLQMRGVRCESCHGPGEYHVQLMQGGERPADLTDGGRDALGLVPASTQNCVQCHDSENSVNFDLDAYWPLVRHPKGAE